MTLAAHMALMAALKQKTTKRPEHRMHRRTEKATAKRRVTAKIARRSRKINRLRR